MSDDKQGHANLNKLTDRSCVFSLSITFHYDQTLKSYESALQKRSYAKLLEKMSDTVSIQGNQCF